MQDEELLKPFKRSKEYYKENDLFLVSLPSCLRQKDEYQYCLGKDISNRNSNWAGNIALQRIQLKYCFSPVRESKNSILDHFNKTESCSFLQRDSGNSISSNRSCGIFNQESLMFPISQDIKTNDNYISISNEYDEKYKSKLPLFFSTVNQKSETLYLKERETLETSDEKNESCVKNRLTFGSFPHSNMKKINIDYEIPVPSTTVESLIKKLKSSKPTIIVFLDLDFYTKFLWKLKKELPLGIHFIGFFGRRNRIPKNPHTVLVKLYETYRFHLHPLAGIKGKGSCAKSLISSVYAADSDLPKHVEFIIMTCFTAEIQKLQANINKGGRNCILVPKTVNLESYFYEIISDHYY